MYEIISCGKTLPEAYHSALERLNFYNREVPCPDYNTNQIECSMTMVVEEPTSEPMISRLFVGDPRSLEQYRQEILYGILDFEVEAGKWEYTYHERIAPYLPWLVNELTRNPYSRRAVISTFKEKDLESYSPPCLMTLHFFIREDKLCLKTTFRSNDAAKAAFMNAFALICLQASVAEELGVPVGQYVQRSESYHVYERDYEMLEHYVTTIKSGRNISYKYRGDWDDHMEEAKPEIAKMVEDLKTIESLKKIDGIS